MRLRTFTASDMQLAMQMVRDTLGEDAVIISTRSGDNHNTVQITAAYDDVDADEAVENMDSWFDILNNKPAAPSAVPNTFAIQDNEPSGFTGSTPASHSHIPVAEEKIGTIPVRIAHRIEHILKYHGVNEYVLEFLLEKLDNVTTQEMLQYQHYQDPVERWFAALMNASFDIAPLELRHDSCRHILIGTPGAGKTLTTAKIAAYCVKYNRPVHVISTDNKRAGGVEQLAAITDILGIELMVAESRQTLKAILSDIPLAETVIVDSAGANPYDFYELKELAEYAGLIELDPVLIYPAGSDPFEADEVARAFSFIGVEKMIVTRMDTARRFGSILNAAHAAGLKFSNLTGSEKILGSFDPCTPEYLTKLFMDYQPKDGA